jgi:predicted transcriptional regulator
MIDEQLAMNAPIFPASQRKRLQRLARRAHRTPDEMLPSVLKDGLDYTEWLVAQVNAGLAELDAGHEMSWADLEAVIAKRRSARAGKRSKAA